MKGLAANHVLLALLAALVLRPGGFASAPPAAFLTAAALIEGLYLLRWARSPNRAACSGVAALIWGLLIVWEIATTRTGSANPILVPAPEDVFYVFWTARALMLRGVVSSLGLLAVGFAVSLTLGVTLGLAAGWFRTPGDVLMPIARVLSPIPPVIYSPYIVALMPTFRSAAAAILILGIFWPTFMNMAGRVKAIDRRILDTARTMNVSGPTMIFRVLLPYVTPGIFAGLRVSLSTSFLLLTVAEMSGAASGMGYFIKNYSDYANYTNVAAGIILVGIVVTLLNRLLTALERRCVRWRE